MAHDNKTHMHLAGDRGAAVPIPPAAQPSWQVLLVGGCAQAQAALALAQQRLQVQGRTLAVQQAATAEHARTLLARTGDCALVLIDAAPELAEALALVQYIREDLGNPNVRLLWLMGPNHAAPVWECIERYDIDECVAPSQWAQPQCLFASLRRALMAYAHLHQLQTGRQGLERVQEAAAVLCQRTDLQTFATDLLAQLCHLLGQPNNTSACVVLQERQGCPYVLSASGACQAWRDQTLPGLPAGPAATALRHTLQQQTHQWYDDALCLYIPGSHGSALLLWLQAAPATDALAHGLLQVFASYAALALENLQLYLSINDLAFTDPLVRLPNRNAMVVALERRQWLDGTLALLDLDGFSDINSVLDEHFGDTVLCAVAHRLVTELSAHALVARVGGDLFGIYGSADRVTAENLARIFAQPFVINDGEPLRLAATAGLVQMSNTSISGVVALKHAGVALKQAKSRARGKSMYFEPTQIDAASDRMHMLNRLRAAFSEERLFLHYQPLVHLGTGRVVGAECLLRWRRSDGRMVPPDQFIPLAEQSGLMIALGQWVVRTALLWRRSLRGVVDEDFRVAINVSHAQFAEPNFVDVFLILLRELQVPGAQVEIELTESVAVGNVQQLVAKLTQLRAAGVRVAMDDFGTGYSSLSIIQRLALDKLKIDRSFISGAQAQNNTFEIARTIITLAEHLHLATTAEGIETQEQCEALLAAGCELGQGYWFSRPLAEADFPQWLHHYSTSQSHGESNG